MAGLSTETIVQGLATYLVLLFSVSFHEAAHAWAALRMGDDLAAREGRISLNPMVHIDPIGTVLVPLLQIVFSGIPFLAWAKPTPIVPRRFRQYRKGQVLVAGAGPASNLILAVLFLALLFFAARAGLLSADSPLPLLLISGVQLNVLLAVFNLVPLPPLDGATITSFSLPQSMGQAYDRFVEPWGMWLLLLFVATPLASFVLSPFLAVTRLLILRTLGYS